MAMYRYRTLAAAPRSHISIPVRSLGRSFAFSPGKGTRADASDAELAALKSAIAGRSVCEDVKGLPAVLEHRADGLPLAQFLAIDPE